MLIALHLLPHLSSQLPKPNPTSSRPFPLLPANFLSFSYQLPHEFNSRFLPRAASIGSSGAEYSEPLVVDDRGRQRRRRSVAGIDQDELVDPEKLADPDSCFCELNGIKIHHKICHHEAEGEIKEPSLESTESGVRKIGLPMILLHGFGASVFSWDRVMKPLARVGGSKVLAFDRPAFGLTSRTCSFEDSKPLNPYSMAFSVFATLSFIEMLGSGKAILMGHSAGCLVAVNTYFEAPERIAALILVAPAILAPLLPRKVVKESAMEKGEQRKEGSSSADVSENPFVGIWRGFLALFMRLARLAAGMLRGMTDMVGSLYNKALSAVLRSTIAVMLIRMIMDKFGILAIRNAWYDASQVSDYVLQGYTKPLRVKGWEMALLEYTVAMITNSTSKPPLSERLSEISCPVLIVTGDNDRLVPSWNAERLSQAIPGSALEVVKKCGHLPHEERVDEFLSIVERFLQRVLGVQNEQLLQTAA
ncbi:uncharacterized protein [Typha latifolia]|uniref:uncharacterized protein n=1 Tax=Typha latifolia TaxID=4733 RepID=UPI003C2DC37E